MIRFSRVSLAVIAFGLLAAGVASGALPVITSQPHDGQGRFNTLLDYGQDECRHTLKIIAQSDNGPLTYQWKKNGVNLTHPTATQSILELIPTVLSDAGVYTCAVTNASGTVQSQPSKLVIVDTTPAAFVAATGQLTANIKTIVTAPPSGTGTTLAYRWYKVVGGTPVRLTTSHAADFSGFTSNMLVVKNVSIGDSGEYFCRIFANGYSMDGGFRKLVVLPPPASKIASLGESVGLAVEPVGADGVDGLTYQWKKGSVVVKPASADPTFTIPSATLADSGAYTCTVTVPGSLPVTTGAAQVFVVDTASKTFFAAVGQSPTLNFSPAPAGVAYQFQWFSRSGAGDTALVDDANFANVTKASLQVKVAAAEDAIDYFCRITAYGNSEDTGLRRLILIPAPLSTTVAAGSTAELEILPTGLAADQATIDAMTFQWKKGTTVLDGATNRVLTIDDVTAANAGDYTCVVTLPGVGTVTSPPGKIVVVDTSTPTTLAVKGASPTLSITASAGIGQTYQWFRAVTNEQLANDAKYAGVTTKILTIKLASEADAGGYYCRVFNYNEFADSGVRTLVVVPPPQSQLVRLGEALNLDIVPAGADPAMRASMTFEWKKGTTTLSGPTTNISTFTINPTAMTDSGLYACAVTIPGVGTVTSAAAKAVLINPAPATKMVLKGASPTFAVPVSGVGHTFQWYKVGNPNPLVNDTEYAGVTSAVLTVKLAQLDDAGQYFCRVSGAGFNPAFVDGGLQTLVVISPPQSIFVDRGSVLPLEVIPSDNPPAPLTYLWRKNTTDLTGETGPIYTIDEVDFADGASYTCLVTLQTPTPLSLRTPAAKVAVVDLTEASVIAVSGKSAILNVSTSGTGQTYMWYRVVGGVKTPLANDLVKYSGVTTKSMTIKNAGLADGGLYRCEVMAYGRTVCVGLRTLEVVESPASRLLAVGEALNLEVISSHVIDPLNYQWKKGTAILTPITNDATFDIDPVALSNFGDYLCTVGVPGAGSVVTNAAKVSVVDLSAKMVHVNKGLKALLSVATTGAGMTYQWFRLDGANKLLLSNDAKYTGVTTKVLNVLNCDEPDAGQFVCDVTAYGRTLTTEPVTLVVHFKPEFNGLNPPTAIVGGSYFYQIPVDPDPLKAPTLYAATPLPAGIVVNTATGVLSGKPTTAATTDVKFTISNSAGKTEMTVPITVNALPAYLQGNYVGSIARHPFLGGELGGKFEMIVGSTAAVSGKVTLGTVVRMFAGKLEVSGTDSSTATASATVTAGTGASALTVSFDLGTDNLLTNGQITDTVDVIVFDGWRNTFTAGTAADYTGLYNFGILIADGDPNLGNDAVPQGVGYGTFTVMANGTFSVTNGKTPDGEALTFSSFVGPSGQGEMFRVVGPVGAKGSMVGEFSINDQGNSDTADNTLLGSATFSRPPDPSATQRLYKTGFVPYDLVVDGGRYVPPVFPKLILGVEDGTDNATLSFEHGGLAGADSNPNVSVSIKNGNVVSIAANPTLTKIATAGSSIATNGLFSGSFVLKDEDPTTATVDADEWTRSVTFNGVIYPSGGQLVGAGYFLLEQIPTNDPPATTRTTSPKLSGAVFFEPVP